jgi:hypothetical protein
LREAEFVVVIAPRARRERIPAAQLAQPAATVLFVSSSTVQWLLRRKHARRRAITGKNCVMRASRAEGNCVLLLNRNGLNRRSGAVPRT